MTHDRFVTVATRQRSHGLRDVLFAALGASLLAFQVAAFNVAWTTSPGEALADRLHQSAPVEQMADEKTADGREA